ncbi:MAG: VIT1/CCC1 transporter family protein [Methanomassiliicoccales archaeon]|nr:MAG: VIT1/CCC1 transporter family protein [Methanomassiliicoccales archaeon]
MTGTERPHILSMRKGHLGKKMEGRGRSLLTVLTPSDTLSEIVYGVITALAVTNALWFTLDGRESDAFVITATLLVNAAWGISDSIIYLLRAAVDKNAAYSDLHSLRELTEEEAKEMIDASLEGTVVSALHPEDRRKIVDDIYMHSKKTRPVRSGLDRWDVIGAVASFLLYVLAALPVLIPHIFLIGLLTPIILSNIIGIVIMFFIGYVWAGRVRGPRFKAGVIMAMSGVVMITIITLVGG